LGEADESDYAKSYHKFMNSFRTCHHQHGYTIVWGMFVNLCMGRLV